MISEIALVTGATSGIGEATARLLAKNKYNLILLGRRADRLNALAAELEKEFGIATHCITADVTQKDLVFEQIGKLPSAFRNINILVNNAGLAAGLGPVDEGLLSDWESMIDTNVKGLLYVSKAVIPLMPKDGSAHIVNVGSIAGKEAYANGNVYCATKAAVDQLTKGMRIDLARFPIRVSVIHPGAVETEFSMVRFKGDTERAAKVYEGFENLVASDCAEAIWFMLNRPKHVNINELVIMPTAQPNASTILRK